jgi:hypothetical protein
MNKILYPVILVIGISFSTTFNVCSQTTNKKIDVPEWALPGSASHNQVPPPADFHRVTITDNTTIGIFQGQSDIGAALVPGSSSYDPVKKQYTIVSAGYNVWYFRDEFRYLWKKSSGDFSFTANINFPDTAGYFDRKAILAIRQSLEDNSKEAMVALHGGGLIHLAYRPENGQNMKEMKVSQRSAVRIGIEKRGDSFSIFVSLKGEPMQQIGSSVQLHLDEPFYIGIGFCSHQPVTIDKAIISDVVLENEAGKVH